MSHTTAARWIALVALLLLANVPQTSAQTDQRCFPETGQCISGRIRQFWEQNGGLPVFGFPIGPQREQTIEGKAVQAQNFERNRLELHPENARPYDVLLGRLGADRLAQLGKDWQTYPKGGNQPGCRYFPETDQSVCGTILRAWRASGLEIDGRSGKSESENLALFGLPLSPLVTERQADGQERQIQWFERARFEIHPENQPPYDVLLGLLGNELRDGGGSAPPPAPPAAPPILPPPSYNDCQADPNPGAAPNYPVRITAINKAAETVTLQNVSPEAIDLTGWHMCSITGNQQHPIGGSIAPGQSIVFPGPSGTIWNNSSNDDGALYTPEGQLASYFDA